MNFVSGFDASATGGLISTIGFTTQALSGGATVASTVQEPTITDATTISELQTLALTDTVDQHPRLRHRSGRQLHDVGGHHRRYVHGHGPVAQRNRDSDDLQRHRRQRQRHDHRRRRILGRLRDDDAAGRRDGGPVDPRRLQSDLAGNRQFHSGVVHQRGRHVDGRRRRAAGGHQLLRPDRRHAGQNDGGGHA